MSYTVSLTVDQVIKALAGFVEPFVGASTIVRGQINRVPQPQSPCVVLTELLQVDLETPVASYIDPYPTPGGRAEYAGPKRIDIQIDFYGDDAGDYCAAVKGVYRTSYATEQFPDGIKPLYCTDGMQMPLVTGEQQYLGRWTLTASLQYNPVVAVPQEFAEELEATLEAPVDLQ